jgi:indole-3-glycerol phosphate synthase
MFARITEGNGRMSLLYNIVRHKQDEIARRKKDVPEKMLMQKIDTRTRDFAHALCAPGLSLIAEIKYRSPSAGVMPDQRDPVTRAHAFEESGAQAISVLTDTRFFGGSQEHFRLVRTNTSLPVLRKDFILDEYQIYESRAMGADAILLIVRLLDEHDLQRFIAIAGELNMISLVEVHTEQEILRATRAHAQYIGINNRDLDTLKVDIQRSLCLKACVPEYCMTVAESGITTRGDMQQIEDAGFNGVLIGHALAVSPHTQEKIQLLQGRSHDTT